MAHCGGFVEICHELGIVAVQPFETDQIGIEIGAQMFDPACQVRLDNPRPRPENISGHVLRRRQALYSERNARRDSEHRI